MGALGKLVFALLLTASLANAFSVTYTNINNSIFRNESAVFALTIMNTKGFQDSFQVSTRDPDWVLTTQPPLSSIPALSSQSYLLFLKPKQDVEPGPYAVPVKVKSLMTGKFKEDNLLVSVKQGSPFLGEYAPTVALDAVISREVDPREKVSLKVKLSNKNPRDLPGLKVKVSGLFSKQDVVHLYPLEQKTVEYLLSTDPLTKPGVYRVRVEAVLGNETLAESSKEVEVKPYSELREESTSSSYLFRKQTLFEITNEGNVERRVVKKLSLPLWKKPFASFKPEPVKVREGGETFYEWRKTLQPLESFKVEVVENYRSLALIFLASIIGVAAYYLFRSPVVVKKSAVTINEKEDLKVTLELKNRGKHRVRNVRISDKVPSLGDVYKKTEIGTVKPSKLVKTSKGTLLKWELETLEPYEERIITYKVKPKLKLIGGMRLPAARVVFEASEGKERVAYSNACTVIKQT